MARRRRQERFSLLLGRRDPKRPSAGPFPSRNRRGVAARAGAYGQLRRRTARAGLVAMGAWLRPGRWAEEARAAPPLPSPQWPGVGAAGPRRGPSEASGGRHHGSVPPARLRGAL